MKKQLAMLSIRQIVHTRLKIVAQDKTTSKDRGIAKLILQVVDEKGILVMISDN